MITYETIRSVHRAEKDEQLAKLPEGFFRGVQQWLSHKKVRGDTSSMLEAESAKKLIEDIINRRQRKILLAALGSARGSAPPQNMTADELGFFDRMLLQLKAQQNDMKEKMFGAGFLIEQKMEEARRSVEEMKAPITVNPAVQPQHSEALAAEQSKQISQSHINTGNVAKEPQSALIADQKPLKPLNSTKKVRILRELSRFVDADGKEYGPFKTGETADVPDDVFRLLSISHAVETTT